jgi:hypothetical protein
MAYRDDRQALSLQVAALEQENEKLRDQVEQLEGETKRLREENRVERQKTGTGRDCVMCGGSLLPVALFAGRNLRTPIPIVLSTLRFGDPDGGFTRSAPVKAKVCSSCGFIHCFIEIGEGEEQHPLSAEDEEPKPP